VQHEQDELDLSATLEMTKGALEMTKDALEMTKDALEMTKFDLAEQQPPSS
jgi:hypothetical protein